MYKLYLHDLLSTLQRDAEGLHMGPYFVGSPTCADDLLLMASSELDMQMMLDAVHTYSGTHKYRINPTKTTLTYYGKKPESDLCLGNVIIKPATDFIHLGISRTNTAKNNRALMEDRASTGRRTVYALMPSGLHGQDGLSPVSAAAVIRAYVLPRMIHGLEALILSQSDLLVLERTYRQILRDLQSLSKRTATEAIYLLMGMLPIEAEIHIRTLSLFGAVTRLEDGNMLKNLAERQLALKSNPRTCWFRYALDIAKTYGLESFVWSNLLHHGSKEAWKGLVAQTVKDHWLCSLRRTAAAKSSLSFLITIHLQAGEPHPIWPADAPPSSILAASYRAKMLTGTYILQSTRAKYNQHEVDATCLLCGGDTEDMVHFIVMCPTLHEVRSIKLATEVTPIAERLGEAIPEEATDRCRFILNGGHIPNQLRDVPDTSPSLNIVESSSAFQSKLQKACSMLCYKLHMKRQELLSYQHRLVAP